MSPTFYNVGGYSVAPPAGSTLWEVVSPMGKTRCTEAEVRVLLDLEDDADLLEYLMNPEEERADQSLDYRVTGQGLGIEVMEQPALIERAYLRTWKPVVSGRDVREERRAKAVEHCYYDGGFSSDCTMPTDYRPDIKALQREGAARAKRARARLGLEDPETKVTAW